MTRFTLCRLLFSLLIIVFINSCSLQSAFQDDSLKVEEIQNFALDGDDSEWAGIPFRKLYADPLGNYPEQEDLIANFKLAWTGSELAFLFEIEDDSFVSDTIFPWRGDAVEIFLAESRGGNDAVQYSIVYSISGCDNQSHFTIQDRRKFLDKSLEKPVFNACVRHTENKIYVECAVKYDIFEKENDKKDLALQVYIDDSDKVNDEERNQLTWYPNGHTYLNSFAMHSIKLSKGESTLRSGYGGVVIKDNKSLNLFVFGADSGDQVSVYSGDNELFSKVSTLTESSESNIWDLSDFNLDIESDTLIIHFNNQPAFMVDLFFSPRIYEELEAPRFEREIRIFRAKDRIRMPDPGGTLFIGSSSIRMWNTVQKDFPELNIVHRGFGGSTSEEALAYIDQIVLPYKPSRIVYYEGDNDIPRGIPIPGIISNMKEFIEITSMQKPVPEIYLISPKPAIARIHLWPEYEKLHDAMIKLSDEYENVVFVDVAMEMFKEDGELNKDIFIEDGVHMNDEGYRIWTEVIRKAMEL